jgi:hypothetical protein
MVLKKSPYSGIVKVSRNDRHRITESLCPWRLLVIHRYPVLQRSLMPPGAQRIVGKRRAETKLAKLAEAVRRVRFTDWFGWRCMVGLSLLRSTELDASIERTAQHTAKPSAKRSGAQRGAAPTEARVLRPNSPAWFDATTVRTLRQSAPRCATDEPWMQREQQPIAGFIIAASVPRTPLKFFYNAERRTLQFAGFQTAQRSDAA